MTQTERPLVRVCTDDLGNLSATDASIAGLREVPIQV